MGSINSVLTFAGMPSLPLGGVGESGSGRIHGPDGLREFSRTKAVTRQRFPLPFPMLSFDRPGFVLPAVKAAMRLRHGRPRRPRPGQPARRGASLQGQQRSDQSDGAAGL